MNILDTICAPSTPPGLGAIAVVRLSGSQSWLITHKIFSKKNLLDCASHTLHFGTIQHDGKILDEVVVGLFKGPNSFTKEDVVEISCHGSPYIVRQILKLLVEHGARMAKPGEFTQRAFLHGRFDLAQAEAVADLIAADHEAAHDIALNQMRGGFSDELKRLREELLRFASLLELELDFSEEDVEFADRTQLQTLTENILVVIDKLIVSFVSGNALKNGVQVVIAGKPNAGKSTLLNALLKEEKAIVSEIAGTTRDVIEDQIILQGIPFRFADTAGLRDAQDAIEAIGIARSYQKMQEASIILYLFDASITSVEEIEAVRKQMASFAIPYILVANKVDLANQKEPPKEIIPISAAQKIGLEQIEATLLQHINLGMFKGGDTMVTNLRHYESLIHTQTALKEVQEGMRLGITADLLAEHLKDALHHLGLITGEFTSDEVLGAIFSKFCIGK